MTSVFSHNLKVLTVYFLTAYQAQAAQANRFLIFRYLLLPKKQPLTQVKMQKIPPCVQNQQVDNMESLKEYMEKKNILWDFKRIEPPRCLTVTATEDINSEIAFEEIRSCLTKRCQTYKR